MDDGNRAVERLHRRARRARHPSPVNLEDHPHAYMPELRRHVLRSIAVLKGEARERVTALVERARPHARAAQDARPVARAEVV